MNVDRQQLLQHILIHRYAYLVLGLIVLLSLSFWRDLVADWIRDDNYSHGFFIIPISIYLIYRRRTDLVFPSQPSKWGIGMFIFGCVGLIFGVAASEFFTTRVSLVLMISGFALYYLGSSNFLKVWFAFFFLLFMIPIPAIIYYAATMPMQLFASKGTVALLQIIGVPVTRSGNIINLPQYSLEVIEACSGLRSLVTLLALGALYGYLWMPGRLLPVVLFIATIPIAIATNVFRIFITAIGAYTVSVELAEGFLHEISGFMVFFTALIIVLITGAILIWLRNRLRSS